MTRDELQQCLGAFEWNDFECKAASKVVPKDAYKTVSAFANTSGGWLVFGVQEATGGLNVVGVENVDKVQNEFLSTLRSGQKVNHAIDVEPHSYDIDGKTVLAFYIPPTRRSQRPVYLSGNVRDTYIRRGAGDEKCLLTEIERFIRDASTERHEQAGTGIRTIYRGWRKLGRVPPSISNDHASKDFELTLRKQPLITPGMQKFQADLGVHLNEHEASVLADALEREQVTAADIRRVTTSATLGQAKAVGDRLDAQQLFENLGVGIYRVLPTIANRYRARDGQTEQVTEQVESLLAVMGNTPKSSADLLEALALKHRPTFQTTYLKPALEAGLIEMTLPETPRSSKQQYRLTKAGSEVIHRLAIRSDGQD